MNQEPNAAGRLARLIVDGAAMAADVAWRTLGLVRSNLSLALLSVALGLSLWLYVSEAENPPRTEPLPFLLPVEVQNLADDLALLQPIPPVQLTVRAPEDTWDDLRPEDFRVVANLGGLGAGEDQEISINVIKSPDEVFISRISPSVVRVTLEPRIVKEVPVDIKVEGSVPAGYEQGPVTTDPQVTTVRASGPASQVREVEMARAVVSVRGQTVTVDEDVELRPINSTGNIAGNVALEPEVIHVRIPVEQTEVSKTLGVRVAVRGEVAPGYMITSIEWEPNVVEVRGTREELEGLDIVSTEEVDVTGATSDVVRTVRLSVPSGTRVPDVDAVNVRIHVAAQEVERTLLLAPRVIGVLPGLQAEVDTPTVAVVVRGTGPQVTGLSLDSVRVTLDVTGRGAGTYSVEPTVSVPDGIQVVEVRPPTIKVTLSG